MRVAVLIVSLCLSLPISLQALEIFAGANLGHNEALAQAAASGVFIAILFILGAAFALGKPRISQITFILASIFGYAGANNGGGFHDLNIWATAALILAALSYLGVRELKTKRAICKLSGQFDAR